MKLIKRYREKIDNKPIEQFRKEEGRLKVRLNELLEVYAEILVTISIVIAIMASLLPAGDAKGTLLLELFNIVGAAAGVVTICLVIYTIFCLWILDRVYYPRILNDIEEHPWIKDEYKLDCDDLSPVSLFKILVLTCFLGFVFSVNAPTDYYEAVVLFVALCSAALPLLSYLISMFVFRYHHKKVVK